MENTVRGFTKHYQVYRKDGINISLQDIFRHKTIGEIVKNTGLEENIEKSDYHIALLRSIKKKAGYDSARDNSIRECIKPEKYPYYFSCITSIMIEKIKYENNINIEKSFVPVAMGSPLTGFVSFDEYPLRLERNDLYYGQMIGFDSPVFEMGIATKDVWFEKLEDGIEYCINCLKNNELVVVTGSTYYLNYTHDYLLDEREWAERLSKGMERLSYIDSERGRIGYAHMFMLVDATDTGYVIYDTTFDFYGEIPAKDFHRSFTGLKGMKFLDGLPVQETNLPHLVIEMGTKNLKDIDNIYFCRKALKEYIKGQLYTGRIHVDMYGADGKPTPVTITAGIEAFNSVINAIERFEVLGDYSEHYQYIKSFLSQIFEGWLANYYLVRDCIVDFSRYYSMENEIVDGFISTANWFAALYKQSQEAELSSMNKYIEKAKAELKAVYHQQIELLSKLDAILNKH